MAYTQADLDALDAAIAGGELMVKSKDRQVQYRSLAEMQEIRKTIADSLATAAGNGAPGGIRQLRYQFTTLRGF